MSSHHHPNHHINHHNHHNHHNNNNIPQPNSNSNTTSAANTNTTTTTTNTTNTNTTQPTTTTTTTTTQQSTQTQSQHPQPKPHQLSDDAYKQVEAHLAQTLPDFFVSTPTQSDDPLSRKRKLDPHPWEIEHQNPKRGTTDIPHGADSPIRNLSHATETTPFPASTSDGSFVHPNPTRHPSPTPLFRRSAEPVQANPHLTPDITSRSDQGADVAVASLLTAYLNNPVNPVIGQSTPVSRLTPHAQVSAFGSTENVRQAVLSGLAQSQPKETPSWAKERPTKLEGPFLCISQNGEDPSKEKQPALVYGPVDPNLLDPQTVIAVYYACYPTHNASPPAFKFDLEVLDPILGGTPLIAPPVPAAVSIGVPSVPTKNPHTHKRNSVPSMTREQINDESASGVDPFKVPEVDMSARKRAPRKCGVCGQYYCKGRGNRTLCPSFVQGRDDSPSQAQKYERPAETEESSKPTTIPVELNTTNGGVNHSKDSAPSLIGDRFHDIRVNETITNRSSPPHPDPTTSGGGPIWAYVNPPDQTPLPSNSKVMSTLSDPNRSSEISPNYSSSKTSNNRNSLDQSSSSRKRGPRRCAVCQLMNCPGNGNRKLCNRANSVADGPSTPTPQPNITTSEHQPN